LEVWANADYPRDAVMSRKFGAQGIGLCRTEHMFFETNRLPIVQKMILAKNDKERQQYLDQLLPIQRGDFLGLFEAMGELPVVIRLIDPPLHEFLPKHDELLVEATALRVRIEYMQKEGVNHSTESAKLKETEEMLKAVESMREANPMLGLRGCRLGITMPQITVMQVRAIMEAACEMVKKGVHAHPEIMIPLIGHVNELTNQREILEAETKKVMEEKGVKVDYKFGTMIEIPRAALTSAQIAKYAQFYSFGTNDLTQTTFGFSRDDAEGKFLLKYVEDKILPENPFQSLDQTGVGRLMDICVEEGRKVRPELKIGICGEHGGDPSSVEFCHRANLNYVSASPYRVPVARLAGAQAALEKITKDK
jgi:pyruvate,orthophosphate dikinase